MSFFSYASMAAIFICKANEPSKIIFAILVKIFANMVE
jgi:hypothetical protein